MATNQIKAQVCDGSWALQRPITVQCVSGQWIGQVSGNPAGCPINPVYTSLQTNTFSFSNAVSSFFIDFIGFDGAVQCARMEIKINGVFYPLTVANLSDFPLGTNCTGSFSTISVTPDGYLTLSNTQLSQCRIFINGVNATSVTISTNDGNGTAVSSPFGCTIVPLHLLLFTGRSNECKALLQWKSGIEFNVENIEILRSIDGITFNKVKVVSPKGDNSTYAVETDNKEDAFFRLRINDFDGQYEYSDIIRVKSFCKKQLYNIFPNPVTSSMQVTGLQKDDRLIVKNMLGQVVLSYLTPQLTNKFNLDQLFPGIYYVQVCNSKGDFWGMKIIKK